MTTLHHSPDHVGDAALLSHGLPHLPGVQIGISRSGRPNGAAVIIVGQHFFEGVEAPGGEVVGHAAIVAPARVVAP